MSTWYKKKKFWVAIVTFVATMVTSFTGKAELADKIALIGMTLIGALGLEDFGKARNTVE